MKFLNDSTQIAWYKPTSCGESAVCTECKEPLEKLLGEINKIAKSDSGSFYVLHDRSLWLAGIRSDHPVRNLAVREGQRCMLPLDNENVPAYVFEQKRPLNIPDASEIGERSAFKVERKFDKHTGYPTVSILAIPLIARDQRCIGVLELVNRMSEKGNVMPFTDTDVQKLRDVCENAVLIIENALLRARLEQAHLNTIVRLAVAAEFREDPAATDHLKRLSRIAGCVSQEMGLDESQIQNIRWASPMHDIGKIGIPDSILLKPGPLTPEERRIVQRHCVIGAQILNDPESDLLVSAREIALSHHERWDGQGYPRNLEGNEIPLSGRIVCLCDVFDAIVSQRCYKAAKSLGQAREIIQRERGKHFDPKVVDAFFRAFTDIEKDYDATAVA